MVEGYYRRVYYTNYLPLKNAANETINHASSKRPLIRTEHIPKEWNIPHVVQDGRLFVCVVKNGTGSGPPVPVRHLTATRLWISIPPNPLTRWYTGVKRENIGVR